MRGRKRSRAQGRFESGEHFSAIPDSVLTSPAWACLPHYARSVLTAIAAQYRGTNNGRLGLPRNAAGSYGLTHKDLAAAVPLLAMVGLIERTRIGHSLNGKGICNLYAVTWRALDPSDEFDMPIKVQQPASNEWATWQVPADWRKTVARAKQRAQGRKEKPVSPGEDTTSPQGGTEIGKFLSSRKERVPNSFDPHDEDTSEILARVG